MEITKRTRTIEALDYISNCDICNKEIKGSSESQVRWNMRIHQSSKECKKRIEKEVQE